MKIKELPKIERPREKLLKYGPDKLAPHELLAILLRTGTKELNVCELAKKIVGKFGASVHEVTFSELKKIHGLGETKSLEIIACFELGKRFLKDKKTALILSPKNVWEEMKDVRGNKKEHFVVFYLDTRNQEVAREIVSVGTLNANLVHPREVFEPAVKNLASQIVVSHNHPSGNSQPSDDDLEVTQRLREAGKILGIELLDHVIVTEKGFLSLKEDGFF